VRQTKIIATLGPASSTDATIGELISAGVDVFRLNFSHGTHDTHREAIQRVRAAARKAGRDVAVLQDLSGPKIRTGPIEGGGPLPLRAGDELVIAAGTFAGVPGRVSTAYADLPRAVHPGDTLLLDDGHIQLRVEFTDGREIRTTVVDGGPLGEHKGINAPGVALPAAGLTAKDTADLLVGLEAGVDVVALSFVQTAADIRMVRNVATRAGVPDVPVVAKLERPEAITHLQEILRACDAVMVARGDLGLELPFEQVPRVQKEVTRRARRMGVPVIVATQVLESMRVEPRPTRAEVNDAANAVDDGVDAIMLAGETAAGAYPVKAVQTLDRIIRDAERIPAGGDVALEETHLLSAHGRALCDAAVTLASRANAAAIVAVTRGGKTARVLSALRPGVPVFAATDREVIARRLMGSWGVVPIVSDLRGDLGHVASRLAFSLLQRGVVERSSAVVVAAVTPDMGDDASNFLKLQRV
jgi:pyruvate kinase